MDAIIVGPSARNSTTALNNSVPLHALRPRTDPVCGSMRRTIQEYQE
jgi:hypothetical protein